MPKIAIVLYPGNIKIAAYVASLYVVILHSPVVKSMIVNIRPGNTKQKGEHGFPLFCKALPKGAVTKKQFEK
jgi:hypothetical protein